MGLEKSPGLCNAERRNQLSRSFSLKIAVTRPGKRGKTGVDLENWMPDWACLENRCVGIGPGRKQIHWKYRIVSWSSFARRSRALASATRFDLISFA